MTDLSALFRYLVALRRWWAVVVIATLVGALAGYVSVPEAVADPSEPVVDPSVSYEATQILVRDRSSAVTSNLDIVDLLAREGEILALAAERLGREDAGALAAEVVIEVDRALGTVSITTTQQTEAEAVEVVSEYSTALVSYFDGRDEAEQVAQIERATERLAAIDQRIGELEAELEEQEEGSVEQRLADSELQVLIDQYGALQANVRDLNLLQVDQPPTFTTLQEPVPIMTASGEPVVFQPPTDPLPRVLLGGLAGLLLGIALALVIDRLDTRIRTPEDAEMAFGLPVIAGVPRRDRRRGQQPPVIGEPGSAIAEAYRALVVALRLSPRWQLRRQTPTTDSSVGSAAALPPGLDGVRTILVTSATVGEGKSVTVANLAAGLADSGMHVVVLDCDFNRPSMHELLETSLIPSLRDVPLVADGDVGPLLHDTVIPGVRLLPAGGSGPAPAPLLTQPRDLVRKALAHADIVLIDTGPLLATNEAASLVSEADAVVVVARSGMTSKRDARAATDRLARLQALVAGVALVGAPPRRLYGYGPPQMGTAQIEGASA